MGGEADFSQVPDLTSSVMRTAFQQRATDERKWYLVDATDQRLGRMAAGIAHHLRGKHRPDYSPHLDTGDFVVVINAGKVQVTGNKLAAKLYHRHSGYPGGIHSLTLEQLLQRQPTRVISEAVRGMLPKNPLGRAMYRKLKVYAGAEHPHQAQQPEPLEL